MKINVCLEHANRSAIEWGMRVTGDEAWDISDENLCRICGAEATHVVRELCSGGAIKEKATGNILTGWCCCGH